MSLLNELSDELLKRYVTAARKSRIQARKGVKGDPVKDKALRHIADNPGQSYHHVYKHVQHKEKPKRKNIQRMYAPTDDHKPFGRRHRQAAHKRLKKHHASGDISDTAKEKRRRYLDLPRELQHPSGKAPKDSHIAAKLHPSKSLRKWANRSKGIALATKKLKEENIQPINEISRKKLTDYVRKRWQDRDIKTGTKNYDDHGDEGPAKGYYGHIGVRRPSENNPNIDSKRGERVRRGIRRARQRLGHNSASGRPEFFTRVKSGTGQSGKNLDLKKKPYRFGGPKKNIKEEKANAGLLRWMTNATRRRPKPKPKNEALEQPDVMYTDLRKALNDTHYDTGMELLRKDEKHVKKSASADLNHLKDKIAYLKRQNSKRKTAISSIRRG